MSTLHIISTHLDADTLGDLLRSLNADDAILLSGDGVYLGRPGRLADVGTHCFALADDVVARGLAPAWPAGIAQVGHADFVALCVQHAKSLSWA